VTDVSRVQKEMQQQRIEQLLDKRHRLDLAAVGEIPPQIITQHMDFDAGMSMKRSPSDATDVVLSPQERLLLEQENDMLLEELTGMEQAVQYVPCRRD
jgi:hypothetical protein